MIQYTTEQGDLRLTVVLNTESTIFGENEVLKGTIYDKKSSETISERKRVVKDDISYEVGWLILKLYSDVSKHRSRKERLENAVDNILSGIDD